MHSRGQHSCKFIGTKVSVYIRKELNSRRIGLQSLAVLEHQYGYRDFMLNHSFLDCTVASLFCQAIKEWVISLPLVMGLKSQLLPRRPIWLIRYLLFHATIRKITIYANPLDNHFATLRLWKSFTRISLEHNLSLQCIYLTIRFFHRWSGGKSTLIR